MATTLVLDTFTAVDGTDPTSRDLDTFPAFTGANRWRDSGAPVTGPGETFNNTLVPVDVDYTLGLGQIALSLYSDAEDAFIPDLPYMLVVSGFAGGVDAVTGGLQINLFGAGADYIQLSMGTGGVPGKIEGFAGGSGGDWSTTTTLGDTPHIIGMYVDVSGVATFVVDGVVIDTSGSLGLVGGAISHLDVGITPDNGGLEVYQAGHYIDSVAVYTDLTLDDAITLAGGDGTASTTTLTAYIPMREVSGLFTTSLIAARTEKKWKPRGGVPFGWVTVGGKRIEVENNPSWWEHFRDLGTRKLGGPVFPTLPEIVTQAQLTAAIASSAAAITAAQDQQAAANAQALEALRQVVEGLTTTAAVPPVVLVRQEVPPAPPPPPLLFEGGGGAGGGAGGD